MPRRGLRPDHPSPRLRGEGGPKGRMRGCASLSKVRAGPSLSKVRAAPHLPAGIFSP
ncbi:hypothetical protein MPLB_1130018 [Mesorhizobium sp. ORS 3324]|nr:hypothetical protein MPLB_1130018 [Mesorhizobium sp. ORS 3324]